MNQSIVVFLVNFLQILSNIFTILIVGRVLSSWFSMGRMGQKGRISQFFYDSTEPVLRIVKKLPHKIGMFDLSPIIALFAIDLLSWLLITLLVNYA